MFWICTENGIDSTGIFSLLLSSAYTELRPPLPVAPSHQWGQNSWPQLSKGVFHTIWCHAQHIKGGDIQSDSICLQVTVKHDGALLSWRWLNTCLLMGRSEWISCFALHAQLLLYLLNFLHINAQVFSLLLFRFSSLSHCGGSEWEAVWCLLGDLG